MRPVLSRLALVVALASVAGAARALPAEAESPAPTAPSEGASPPPTDTTAIAPITDEQGASASEAAPALAAGIGPIRWSTDRASRCHRHRGRRFCDGPRRVPEPSDEARARAAALGLDTPRAGHTALENPHPAWLSTIPEGEPRTDLLWPVDGGRLWRGYGMHARLRRARNGRVVRAQGRRRHEGVDIGATPGTAIRATGDALVAYADNGMRGYGNVVVLVHRDGSSTLYAHCAELYVVPGDLVVRGQTIAAVGDTGLAHGPHLHFEWRVGGRTRDPLARFVERPTPERTSEEPSPEPEA